MLRLLRPWVAEYFPAVLCSRLNLPFSAPPLWQEGVNFNTPLVPSDGAPYKAEAWTPLKIINAAS